MRQLPLHKGCSKRHLPDQKSSILKHLSNIAFFSFLSFPRIGNIPAGFLIFIFPTSKSSICVLDATVQLSYNNAIVVNLKNCQVRLSDLDSYCIFPALTSAFYMVGLQWIVFKIETLYPYGLETYGFFFCIVPKV